MFQPLVFGSLQQQREFDWIFQHDKYTVAVSLSLLITDCAKIIYCILLYKVTQF